MSAAVCAFPSVDAAVQTVIQTIQIGVPVARIELLDPLTITAVNRHSKTTLQGSAPRFSSNSTAAPPAVEEQAQFVQEHRRRIRRRKLRMGHPPEDRSRLWQARHDAYFACLQPEARLPCLPDRRLRADLAPGRMHRSATNEPTSQKVSIPIMLFGHVGDGNFHLVVLVDPDNAKDMEEAEWINDACR
jgi:D-lactate dehydrogenase (cytochrome)